MEMTSKEYLLDEIANLKKDLNSLSKRVEKLKCQTSPEAERCNISKDYEFALFIKNGKTYLYKKGNNVGGYCSTDFERDIVLIIKKAQEQLKEKQKKIDIAISYFESEEFKESCKVLTEKLDNTGGYGYWLIVREYIDCVKERLR